MEDENSKDNYFTSVLQILLPIAGAVLFALLIFIRSRGQSFRKVSFSKIGPDAYAIVLERSDFINTNGEEVLLFLEGHALNGRQVNSLAQQNSMAMLSMPWGAPTWNRFPQNQSSRVTPARVYRQDSYLYEKSDFVPS